MSNNPTRVVCLLATCAVSATAQEVLWRVEGVYDQLERGVVLRRLGDVNGDGWDDFLEIGLGRHGPAAALRDEVWVTSGHDGHILSWYVPNQLQLDYLSLAALGDMDGDNIPDYAVTVWSTISSVAQQIEVHSGLDHHLLWTATIPNAAVAYYGHTIAGYIDIDRDGRNDLITSATRLSPGGTVIAYDNSGVEFYRIVDPLPNVTIGSYLAPLGADLDGDGCGDFLVTGPDSPGRGAVLVVSGRTGAILRISYGVQPGDDLFFATGCGDLDGDGVPDYAGGGLFGNYVVTTFSGATGSPIWTYRNTIGTGFVPQGFLDLDQDGVNDVITCGGEEVQVLSGRDASMLYSFFSSWPLGGTCTGEHTVLAPPPGEQYPLIVYSESCWSPLSGGTTQYSQMFALRGSPPGVRAFGAGDASGSLPFPRMGMRKLAGGLMRFSLSSTLPGALAVLALGISDQTIGGQNLPLPLDPFGLPGITLLTSSDALLFALTGSAAPNAGYEGLDLRIPLAAAGTPLVGQWLWLDPTDPTRHGSTAGHRFFVH